MNMTEYQICKEEVGEMRDLVLEGLHKGNHKDPNTGELYPFFVSQIFSVVDILQEHGYCKASDVRKEMIKEIWERLSSIRYEATESVVSYSMKLVAEFERIFAENDMEIQE